MSLAGPALGVLGATPSAGGGGGGMALIDRQVLAAAVQTVTFAVIPQTYEDLILQIVARSNTGGHVDTPDLNFNSDTGGHYYCTQFYCNGGANQPPAEPNSGDTAMSLTSIPGAGASFGTPGFVRVWIPSYARAVWDKLVEVLSGNYNTSGGGQVLIATGWWASPAAINRIDLTVGAQFEAGSVFSLYGVS